MINRFFTHVGLGALVLGFLISFNAHADEPGSAASQNMQMFTPEYQRQLANNESTAAPKNSAPTQADSAQLRRIDELTQHVDHIR